MPGKKSRELTESELAKILSEKEIKQLKNYQDWQEDRLMILLPLTSKVYRDINDYVKYLPKAEKRHEERLGLMLAEEERYIDARIRERMQDREKMRNVFLTQYRTYQPISGDVPDGSPGITLPRGINLSHGPLAFKKKP